MSDENYKLCYVDGSWAYFTTQDLDKQWGDDWDDAPYKHNAGRPYEPCWHRANGKDCQCETCKRDWNEDGTPKWSIKKIAWEADLVPPCDGCSNSQFSVEAINRGDVAWLRPGYCETARPIPAGTTLPEFRRLVRLAGGQTYEEVIAQ